MKDLITMIIMIAVIFLIGKAAESYPVFGTILIVFIIGIGIFGITRGLKK